MCLASITDVDAHHANGIYHEDPAEYKFSYGVRETCDGMFSMEASDDHTPLYETAQREHLMSPSLSYEELINDIKEEDSLDNNGIGPTRRVDPLYRRRVQNPITGEIEWDESSMVPPMTGNVTAMMGPANTVETI